MTSIVLLVLAAVVVATYLSLLRPGTDGPTAATAAPSATTVATEAPRVLGATVTTVAPASPATTSTAVPGNSPSCSVIPPDAADGTMAVRVAYPCPGGQSAASFSWVTRRVPVSDRVLTATLGEMVKGPSPAEQEAGFRSYWSDETAGAVTGITLSSGVAYVDLEPMPAGVPESPEAGAEWLASMAGTVFQFNTIRSLELRTEGDCDAFWRAIGGTDCLRLDRTRWSQQLASWREATAGPPEARG